MVSALIQYSNNGSTTIPLPNGASALLLTGTLLTLSPQSATGITSITYVFSAPGTPLDGVVLSPGASPWAESIWLPVAAGSAVVTTQVNGLASTSNTLNFVTQISSGTGGGSTATLPFASLATTAPSGPRASVFSDGYLTTGDGGAGTFSWSATAPFAPDGGTISSALGGGFWLRTIAAERVFSTKFYGAKGDAVTNDTAAVNACFAAAKQASNAMNIYGLGGSVTVLIDGTSLVDGLTLSNVVGLCIRGTGRGQCGFVGSPSNGGLDLLTLTNCQKCHVDQLSLVPYNGTLPLASSVSAGSTSIQVGAPLSTSYAGHQIAILRRDQSCSEMVTVASSYAIASTTVPLAAGTQRAWSSHDIVCIGSRSGLMIYNDITAPGYTRNSHENHIADVDIGGPNAGSGLWGFAVDHQSSSDFDNETHSFERVTVTNAAVAAMHAAGINAIGLEVRSCNLQAPVAIEALGGSCGRVYGGILTATQTTLVVGGSQQHDWIIEGAEEENGATAIYSPTSASTTDLKIRAHGWDRKGNGGQTTTAGAFSGATVSVTGSGASYLRPGQTIFISDGTVHGEYLTVSSIAPGDLSLGQNDSVTFTGSPINVYLAGSVVNAPTVEVHGTRSRIDLVACNLSPGNLNGMFIQLAETSVGSLLSSCNIILGDLGICGWNIDGGFITFTRTRINQPISAASGVTRGQEKYANGGAMFGNPYVGVAPTTGFYTIS